MPKYVRCQNRSYIYSIMYWGWGWGVYFLISKVDIFSYKTTVNPYICILFRFAVCVCVKCFLLFCYSSIDKVLFKSHLHLLMLNCCSYYVHPPGGWIYYFCFFRRPMSVVRCPMSGVRRPMSGVTHGFRSFKGKVLELLSPNLVCRLIGSVACLGLLLAVVPLLLTE